MHRSLPSHAQVVELHLLFEFAYRSCGLNPLAEVRINANVVWWLLFGLWSSRRLEDSITNSHPACSNHESDSYFYIE